ncbi:hypothetical protein BSL78_12437 [Apostichopus japonicus]|uniref:Uncharacterized protein n=1 Tax=Stichopus japonicus TaxID=307972 RepID=A0A2G8KRT2_STIJA|nr:hypothetical protein BSL78_12437 [Apostichopus japonicus]
MMVLFLQHAKIEELIRLKKKLEDLKASWQSNGDKGGQHEQKGCQKEAKEGKEEDLLESRLKTLKDKGKMKRRRLSSSKRSQSLSSKLMEELLEEDEG